MPSTTCEHCRHFVPDPVNPRAGMGTCQRGQGMWHPNAPHHCKQRETKV